MGEKYLLFLVSYLCVFITFSVKRHGIWVKAKNFYSFFATRTRACLKAKLTHNQEENGEKHGELESRLTVQ